MNILHGINVINEIEPMNQKFLMWWNINIELDFTYYSILKQKTHKIL